MGRGGGSSDQANRRPERRDSGGRGDGRDLRGTALRVNEELQGSNRIPEFLREVLNHQVVTFASTGPDGLLFHVANGAPLRHSNFSKKVWQPAVEAAGCPRSYECTTFVTRPRHS